VISHLWEIVQCYGSFAGFRPSLGLNLALHWESDADRNTAVSGSPCSFPFSCLPVPVAYPGIQGITSVTMN
jgi:hypothetical protein